MSRLPRRVSGIPLFAIFGQQVDDAHKLYRVEGGIAAYAGTLAAGGQRAFAAAAPGADFRYRNAVLRRMTGEELAAAVDPGLVHEFDLVGEER